MIPKSTCFLLWFLLVTSSICLAQKFTPFGTDSSMYHTKGNVHYETTLEHYFSENLEHWLNDKPISITQLNTTLSKYVLDRLSINGNMFLTITRGDRIDNFMAREANTFGGGLSGGLRFEILNFSYHNLYIETLQGMIFTVEDFPPGGTPWNFMVRYGIGYNVQLADKRFISFGWRWMHISNGTGLVPSNPAIDANGLFISFKFAR